MSAAKDMPEFLLFDKEQNEQLKEQNEQLPDERTIFQHICIN
jgi:hypothetical protein